MAETILPYTREELDAQPNPIMSMVGDKLAAIVAAEHWDRLLATARAGLADRGGTDMSAEINSLVKIILETGMEQHQDGDCECRKAVGRLAELARAGLAAVTDQQATALFEQYCGVDRGGYPVLDFDGFKKALNAAREGRTPAHHVDGDPR